MTVGSLAAPVRVQADLMNCADSVGSGGDGDDKAVLGT